MSVKKLIDGIQAHPLVVALVVFALVFIVYNVSKKSSPTATTGTGTPTGTGVGGPTGSEVYASQNYQYPVYNAPVVQQNPPPVTVPGAQHPGSPAPSSTNVYNGILSIIGSIHPANIGPWTAGRQVSYAGQTYTLNPGSQGRLWGKDKATGQQVLLWNGNDYAGGARQVATTGASA